MSLRGNLELDKIQVLLVPNDESNLLYNQK